MGRQPPPGTDAPSSRGAPPCRTEPCKRALAGRQAGNFPVLLIDGTVAGVWHQRRSGRRMIQLTVEPLTPLTTRQRRGLDAQVERVGEILQGTTELTIGTVSVGPHA
ncbi:winged helix DNA-binding domain-containing protein [Streptomyces sp. ID38640]|nr:winged helix DNA-binding domain-containing protein [Streptomyces sp. ID38640]